MPIARSILLVEDSQADIRLTQCVLDQLPVRHALMVARDGEQALRMLRREGEHAALPEPDLVLLDLNLPRKDGREVLAEIRGEAGLAHIPVAILSTSRADHDVLACYRLHANCYLQKPVGLDGFVALLRSVDEFWLRTALLPPKARPA